ncbi:hypothetical protein RhiirA5_503788 [Rhizophagus irregularis]|uniref:Protein kinase domain-containing protein n=1 Tax=Rhizophagus irregularis TaxID=588596 RepID=A0A2N0SG14_9GLOM|nr:hypothetical protein RhiirA5_503788 [Rhizophagus irregularis]PKC74505.1 hypothetical protein RhiirA1_529550 [Rhizophagus irregularis]
MKFFLWLLIIHFIVCNMLVHALPAHEDFRLMERCNIIINRRLSTRDCDEQKLNEDCSQECAHGIHTLHVTRILDGVILYMDPKFSEENHSYNLTEKPDHIYSLGVLFWELTSRLSPFDFENNNHLEIIQIKQDILNNNKLRETPIPITNDKFCFAL